MPIREVSRHLDGVIVLEAQAFADDRGFFMEAWRADQPPGHSMPTEWKQENHSKSAKGVVRGLHFQFDQPMAKLMRVTAGAAFLVAVDIRHGSPTLGQWFGIEASAENRIQLYAPPGFARGFCALVDNTEIQYKCTSLYNPKGESGVLWNDPRIGLKWPVTDPILSPKDAAAQTLDQWLADPRSHAFRY
jgi:dTDP-4-dehydrorhamnose 3,5-epimerase